MLMMPSTDDDRHLEPPAPALRFFDVGLPRGRLSFEAHAGELVHLSGGAPIAQLRVLAIASGHSFGGPGRCEIDGLDTKSLDAHQREALRSRQVARALLSDSLQPHLPLLANVAQPALTRGVPAPVALHRASLELDALGMAEQQSLPPSALNAAETRLALVARALVCRPRLLIVERPEVGLGGSEITSLRIALRSAAAAGCCILMTSMHPRLAAAADRWVEIESPPLPQ